METTIPTLDDPRVLRHVAIDLGYRLLTWDTGRMGYHVGRFGKHVLGYAFYAPDGSVLFSGEDYGCAPGHAIDSDDALRNLLGFLTLRPGDTDADYFASYTEAQHAFAASDAEYLSLWAHDDATEPFTEIES